MNPFPNGWLLHIETGSYDDHMVKLIGFYLDEAVARDRFYVLCKELADYKNTNRRPHVDDFLSNGYSPDDHQTFLLLGQADKFWRDHNSDHEHYDTRSYWLEEWINGDKSPVRRIKGEYFGLSTK